MREIYEERVKSSRRRARTGFVFVFVFTGVVLLNIGITIGHIMLDRPYFWVNALAAVVAGWATHSVLETAREHREDADKWQEFADADEPWN